MLRCSLVFQREWGRGELVAYFALDVVAELLEGVDTCHLFGLDFETELALDDDYNVHEVEAINAEIVLQQGIGVNVFFFYFEVFNEEFSYFFFDFCTVHFI